MVGGEVVDRHRGGFLEAHRIRHRQHLLRGHAHHIRVSSEMRQGQHSLACRVALGTRTERVDHPGHLIADDARRLGGIGIQPLRGHHLRKVQASRADTNADLARAGLRIGRFPHLQGLGPGMPGDPDRSHRHILRRRQPTGAPVLPGADPIYLLKLPGMRLRAPGELAKAKLKTWRISRAAGSLRGCCCDRADPRPSGWRREYGWRVTGSPAGRAAVLVPGARYSTDGPLLMYPGLAVERRGGYTPGRAWAVPEFASDDHERAWVIAQVTAAIDATVVAAGVAAPVVIGKSLASLSAPVVADRGLAAIWLTPVLTDEPTVLALRGCRGSVPAGGRHS